MKLLSKLVLAVIISLLLWEVILEATIEKFSGSYNHPVLGRINKAGIFQQGKEGYCKTHINEWGFRGPDIQSKKKDEYRILLLGDSFTEGFQVKDQQTFCFLLQKQLQKKSHWRITAINAGRSGASPAYYIHLADYYRSKIKPDFVIIETNDGDYTAEIFDLNACFYVKNNRDDYQTVFNNQISSKVFLNKYPKITALIKPVFNLAIIRVGWDNLERIYASSQKPKRITTCLPLQRYDRVIAWCVKKMKEKYPQVLILYLPDKLVKEHSDIEECIKSESMKNQIGFIDMRDILIEYLNKYHQPPSGFDNTMPGTGHMNEIGHRLVAAKLTKYLEGRIQK